MANLSGGGSGGGSYTYVQQALPDAPAEAETWYNTVEEQKSDGNTYNKGGHVYDGTDWIYTAAQSSDIFIEDTSTNLSDTGTFFGPDGSGGVQAAQAGSSPGFMDRAETFTESDVTVTGGGYVNRNALRMDADFAIGEASFNTTTMGSPTDNQYNMKWGNSGQKLYVGIDGGGGGVDEYDLSTPYDLTTASFNGHENHSDNNPYNTMAVTFPRTNHYYQTDAGGMYYAWERMGGSAWRYEVSTNWSVLNSTYDGTYSTSFPFDVGGPYFKQDNGDKLFLIDKDTPAIVEYSCNYNWSPRDHTHLETVTPTIPQYPRDMYISDDGHYLFIWDRNADVASYHLPHAWELRGIEHLQTVDLGSMTGITGYTGGGIFSDDGLQIGIADEANTEVFSLPSDTSPVTFYVEPDDPVNYDSWDVVPFNATLDGESVDVYIEEYSGGSWSEVAGPIADGDNNPASAGNPTRFRVELSRSTSTNQPRLNAIYRRYVV